MTQGPQSWIKKNRLRALLSLAGVIVVSLLICGGYAAPWTGFSGKTLWEWFQLLIIPFVLAGGALWFNWQQSKVEREVAEQRRKADLEIAEQHRKIDLEIAADQQQEGMLQDYLNRMAELLLNQKLRELSGEDDESQMIARVRTLTVLRRLDSARKAAVLLFLDESKLILGESPVMNLEGADLRGANLSGAALDYSNLSMADLSKANLSKATLMEARVYFAKLKAANLHSAYLQEAILRGCDLSGADLTQAILVGVNLSSANLTGANLRGADLSGVDMWEANLTNAEVTSEQLAQAKSLKGATMPDGSKHERGKL